MGELVKLTFKYEGEVCGLPVGPVRRYSCTGRLMQDYGWLTLKQAKRMAKDLKLTLEEW